MDTLRKAGFEAGEINVTCEPGIRDVTITGANQENRGTDIATGAARTLAAAGYDIICYGDMNNGLSLATLMVRMPKPSLKAA